MHYLRLSGPTFWVDVRLAGMNGRWIASADTPDGPSVGLGWTPRQALMRALEPATAPDELLEHGTLG